MNRQIVSECPQHVPAELVVDFDAYHPPDSERDLHLALNLYQASGVPDIVWSVRNGGHWLPTRGKLIAEIYADHEHFSNRLAILPKEIGEAHFGIPQSLDPPEHRPFRKPLNKLLGRDAVKRLEGDIRTLAGSLIEGFRPKGSCEFTRDYSSMLPVSIFLRLVDLPLKDRDKLLELVGCIVRPADAGLTMEEAVSELHDYLRGPVEQRLGSDGKDLLSQMVNSRVFGRALTLEEAVNMAKLVLEGGLDTVSNVMTFAMHFLANNRAHRRELLEQPELIPEAVEEFLRRYGVAFTGRIVKRDVTYAGVQMKEGDPVLLASPLHGLDARENELPLECDFHRVKRKYSTFGKGIHFCPGAHLARLEMRITLEEWLARIPEFELATSDIRCCGGVVAGIEELPLRWNTA